MSTDGENLRLARQLFERWNSGNHEVVPEIVDRDVALHTPLSSTRGAPYEGYDGIRARVAEVESKFESLRFEVEESKELDDGRVLATGVAHVRGRGSDIELDQPMEWLLTFREGKLLRYEAFIDEEANPAGVE
jgi:ketosteroid isomerase-like protein